MKITGCAINWYIGWLNDPAFYLVLDELPKQSEYRYIKKMNPGGLFFYWALQLPFVSHFMETKNGQGYGGNVFTLNMLDGSVVKLKGPWDTGSSGLYRQTGLDTISVGATDSNDRGWVAETILVDALSEYLLTLSPHLVLKPQYMQSNGMSDEQNAVINHGMVTRANSRLFMLDKEICHKVGYWQGDDHWNTKAMWSFFGNVRNLLKDYKNAEYIPPQ